MVLAIVQVAKGKVTLAFGVKNTKNVWAATVLVAALYAMELEE